VSEVLKAYNADGLPVTGKGQTIAVLIDTVPADTDLQSFWKWNNLPTSLNRIVKINVKGGALPPTGSSYLLLVLENVPCTQLCPQISSAGLVIVPPAIVAPAPGVRKQDESAAVPAAEATVRRESCTLRQAADLDLLSLGELLAVDPQHRDTAIAVVEPGGLVVRAGENGDDRNISLGAHRHTFGPIADHNAIDDARGLSIEIHDAYRLDVSCRRARATIVRSKRDLAGRHDRYIVGPEPRREVRSNRPLTRFRRSVTKCLITLDTVLIAPIHPRKQV
jgi:hypothetical protein